MRVSLVMPSALALLAASASGQGIPVVTAAATIGCESCQGPAQFGSIRDVAVSPSGEILVSDRDAPILRRFDAKGKSLWAGGQKGKGPGEFLLPIRLAITPTGMLVVDMSNSRLTDLTPAGRVSVTVPLLSMATTTGVNKRGDMILGLDEMGRSFRVSGRPAGAAALRQVAAFPGSMKNKSLALAPDGAIAVVLDGEKYEIQRLDASGTALAPIVRDIPRPRRSAQEEAEFQQRLGRSMGMMAAEMKKQGMSGTAKPLPIPPAERGLESHIRVDGLYYDDAGRLWVHTMQGDETKTVFDVFSPTATYLGAVTIPMRVHRFALGGNWLVTAGENGDGVPVVSLWTVKE